MSNIRVQCEICNKLIGAHSMKTHLKTCGQESDCRICGKKFSNPRYRKSHELSHNKSYVRQCLTCTDCNTNFTAVSSLNNHKKRCLELQEKKKKKKMKTVVLQPYKRVAKVYIPKPHDIIQESIAADVVHLPDEDIAAVETITCETDDRNQTPIEEIAENWQKVVIETVPQFITINSRNCNINK